MAENSAVKGRFREKYIDKSMQDSVPSELIDLLRLFAIDKRLSNGQINAIFNEDIAPKIVLPEDSVPVEIFKNEKLSALEAIAKFMKEEKGWSFSKIAGTTGRSSKTIWATYNKAVKKMPGKCPFAIPSINIPLHALKNRDLGVQESIVKYLRENCRLSFHKIAVLLNRNDRTIWTAYNRVMKKQEKQNKR